MGDDPDKVLKMRHSFYTARSPKHSGHTQTHCKSEMNVVLPKEYTLMVNNNRKRKSHAPDTVSSFGEYYKKYEHDEVPVKDLNYQELATVGGDKGSLTNSELDKLEMKIFKNMSQELQTDDDSVSSLESNIKFFKTTVQEIFDNFYASMRDFEVYKNRFQEILEKNKEDALADMEDFIKDMIQHIMSSETSLSNDSRRSNFPTVPVKKKDIVDLSNVDADDLSSLVTNTNSTTENLQSVVEAYKNDNYLTDSTTEGRGAKAKQPDKTEEIFNIYLLSGNPCVQIKMNDRNLLSEINIKEPSIINGEGKHVASADNIERLAAKKMELKRYVEQQQDMNVPDRDIPVKVSYAKKNIHLNEDFSQDRDSEKSFISKLCSFLCRKFRKTS